MVCVNPVHQDTDKECTVELGTVHLQMDGTMDNVLDGAQLTQYMAPPDQLPREMLLPGDLVFVVCERRMKYGEGQYYRALRIRRLTVLALTYGSEIQEVEDMLMPHQQCGVATDEEDANVVHQGKRPRGKLCIA